MRPDGTDRDVEKERQHDPTTRFVGLSPPCSRLPKASRLDFIRIGYMLRSGKWRELDHLWDR